MPVRQAWSKRISAARIAVPLVAVGVLLAGCAQTSVPDLNVRSGPGPGHRVTGMISGSGTAVQITCWSYGEPVHRDRVWYRINSPKTGYVTGYYISTGGESPNAPHC